MRKLPSIASGICALLICAAAATAVSAQNAQPWVKSSYAKARLIPGGGETDAGKQTIRAGVQLQLDDGWKTYWRNPGDSGLPASFDFKGSKNLKDAKVLWPAPHRFTDPYGTSIGYEKEVVFPVLISPERADRAVDLDLKLDYAICKDICVPAEARLNLKLEPGTANPTAFDPIISRYLGKVPSKASPQGPKLPSIRKAKGELDRDAPLIVVDAHFPDGIAGADLFVEGPGNIYIPPPQSKDVGENGAVRFTIDLGEAADGSALKGKTLNLTLVSDHGQSETRWTVD
jgi:DsbC/DsbD-like thiol-disulfide interchange protein